MKKVIILYTCDDWHRHSSKIPLGVFTEKFKAVNFAKLHASKSEEGKLDEHNVFLLTTIDQTQNRSENYIIEECELNPTKVNL
jgi:hypothetical protein